MGESISREVANTPTMNLGCAIRTAQWLNAQRQTSNQTIGSAHDDSLEERNRSQKCHAEPCSDVSSVSSRDPRPHISGACFVCEVHSMSEYPAVKRSSGAQPLFFACQKKSVRSTGCPSSRKTQVYRLMKLLRSCIA